MRNGVPTSDRATMTERFIRHGDHLLDVIIVNDPVYLSEPFIRTQDWRLNLNGEPNAWGQCGPAQIADEIPNHKKGYVPHHLPGKNEQLREFPAKRGVPPEAARGGVETTYPEYMLKMKGVPVAAGLSRPAPAEAGAYADAQKIGDTEVLHVQGNVYMIAGAGGNIAVQVGDDGVLLVDTGLSQSIEKVTAAIRQLSTKPIRFIVNTNARPDHTGGNERFAKAGSKMGGGLLVGGYAGDGAMVIAHEAVLKTMSAPTGKTAPVPSSAWPTDAYPGESKEIYSNDEGLEVLHPGPANTDGDSIVYFRRSDVVVTGDVFSMTSYPVIDAEKGGSFSGVLAALNRVIDLTIPKDWQEGGTMVIPGHGRIADEADVVEYRDMITIVRDRIQDMINRGMTVEQVKAARPTRDYDGRYALLGLAPGQYNVTALVPAFVVTGSSPTAPGKTVALALNETVESVDFKLVRGGVITGRVTDSDNRPVMEERVDLLQLDENGNPANRQPGGSLYNYQMNLTDDRGIYRLYGVPAGRYKVSVGTNPNSGFVTTGPRADRQVADVLSA